MDEFTHVRVEVSGGTDMANLVRVASRGADRRQTSKPNEDDATALVKLGPAPRSGGLPTVEFVLYAIDPGAAVSDLSPSDRTFFVYLYPCDAHGQDVESLLPDAAPVAINVSVSLSGDQDDDARKRAERQEAMNKLVRDIEGLRASLRASLRQLEWKSGLVIDLPKVKAMLTEAEERIKERKDLMTRAAEAFKSGASSSSSSSSGDGQQREFRMLRTSPQLQDFMSARKRSPAQFAENSVIGEDVQVEDDEHAEAVARLLGSSAGVVVCRDQSEANKLMARFVHKQSALKVITAEALQRRPFKGKTSSDDQGKLDLGKEPPGGKYAVNLLHFAKGGPEACRLRSTVYFWALGKKLVFDTQANMDRYVKERSGQVGATLLAIKGPGSVRYNPYAASGVQGGGVEPTCVLAGVTSSGVRDRIKGEIVVHSRELKTEEKKKEDLDAIDDCMHRMVFYVQEAEKLLGGSGTVDSPMSDADIDELIGRLTGVPVSSQGTRRGKHSRDGHMLSSTSSPLSPLSGSSRSSSSSSKRSRNGR